MANHWNHRLVKEKRKEGKEEYVVYSIREVFYDENNEPCAIDQSALNLEWFSVNMENQDKPIDEIKQQLEWINQALSAPIIDWEEFTSYVTQEHDKKV